MLDQFIGTCAYKPRNTKSEFRQLPILLLSDETLYALLEGKVRDIYGRSVNRHGLIIATDLRIIFFQKSFWGKSIQADIPLNQVLSVAVAFSKTALLSHVVISTEEHDMLIELCHKEEAEEFKQAVTELLQSQPHFSS